jgi:probable HAF family extracellular repeat protein
MKKRSVIIAAFIGLSHVSFSQFHVKNLFFQTQGVSNQGEVAGYIEWTGPYSIWTPETQAVDVINGIAPGNGVGGGVSFSADGMFLSGTSQGTNGPELSRYDRANDTWTALGSLGFSMDGSYSGGYWISGDGTTVVGNSWADTAGGVGYADAVAWNPTEGMMDLGTLFWGRSTRANAVNYDGSVVVGWQDYNGPWKSAVWRKNPSGGYYPNTYILLDPNGDPNDEYNQMGECTAVSADGNWVGGAGDYANDGNAWIWSEATGVIDLGTLAVGGQSYVAALNENGTVAVGRIQLGPWVPELPFIWTPADGMQNLNDYAHNTLGLVTGNKLIYSANCMSANGDYIAGYGIDTVTYETFAYRLSRTSLGVSEFTSIPVKVYPNPASDVINIDFEGSGTLTIVDAEGKTVTETAVTGNQQWNVSAYAPGVYFLSVRSQNGLVATKNIRFVR